MHGYRLHNTTGDAAARSERPERADGRFASDDRDPNVEPGDGLLLPDSRESLVIARVERAAGSSPRCWRCHCTTPLTSDDRSSPAWRGALRRRIRGVCESVY